MKSLKPIRSAAAVLLIGALLAAAFPFGAFGSQAVAQQPRAWHVDDHVPDYPDATGNADAVNKDHANSPPLEEEECSPHPDDPDDE